MTSIKSRLRSRKRNSTETSDLSADRISKCPKPNVFKMEDFFSKFPHLAGDIFNNLDDEHLVKCSEVGRSWSTFLEEEIFFWKRIIEKYLKQCVGYESMKKTWKKLMNQAGLEMIKKLGLAVKYLLIIHPLECKAFHDVCHHTSLPYFPLELASDVGDFSLCKFILENSEDKNPRNPVGWTGLHVAAQRGHLDICNLIMDNVCDKNPQDDSGSTPLHQAANNGHLQVCRAIMNNVKEKNPRAKCGSTPLHDAAYTGQTGICHIIMNCLENKNPGANNNVTPLHLAAAKGHIRTYQAILSKLENKMPRRDDGFSPLHDAALMGQVEMCKFIVKSNIEDKNPIDNLGLTPKQYLMQKVSWIVKQSNNSASATHANNSNWDSPCEECPFWRNCSCKRE